MNPFQLTTLNPLRGLNEWRLVSLLDQGQRGAYAELQWLYFFVEKRNETARAVKRRLLSALGKLDWDIKTKDCGQDETLKAQALKQQQTLRDAYDRVKRLRVALNHLALAELRGFSHVEKIYAGAGTADPWDITELRPVEQWFWVRDGFYAPWQYNPNARLGTYVGVDVDPAKFIVREVDDAADEIIARLHVRADNSDADWDVFLEDFGVPAVFVTGPPNVPENKEREYQAMAEQVTGKRRGYLPNGATVDTLAAPTGSSVFLERLEYLNGQIVLAGTSGKLTILSESGSGTLAGGAQKDAFDEIAQSIALNVSETMQEGFDAEVLARLHPGEPVLVWFELEAVNEEIGAKALADAKTAFDAGYEMDEEELSEKSGYHLTRIQGAVPTSSPVKEATGAPISTPGAAEKTPATTPIAAPVAKPPQGSPPAEVSTPAPIDPAAVTAATAAQLGVTPEYLAPAQTAIQDLIAKASDGDLSMSDLIASAEEFLSTLPDLAKSMDSSDIATGLENAMRVASEKALQPA